MIKKALLGLILLTGTALAQPAFNGPINYSGSGGSSGGGGGSGTVTSISGGTGILPSTNPCTTTCTLNTTVTPNAQTGTSYALLATDGGKQLSLNNTSAIAVSITGGGTSGFGSGYGLDMADINTGATTLTLGTGVFDNGLTTAAITRGQNAYYWNDGTNGHLALSLPVMAADTILGNFSGAANYPIAGSLPSCSGASNALTYNTSTHALGCNTISGSVSNQNQYVVSNYYWAPNVQTIGGVALAGNRIYWSPFPITKSLTISELGVYVTTLSVGGNVDVAIYASDATTGLPTGSALVSMGSQSTTTAGLVSVTGISTSLPAGAYWIGVNTDNATAAVRSEIAAAGYNTAYMGVPAKANLAASASASTALQTTNQTYGTWPSSPTVTSATSTNAQTPTIFFKVGSIP